MSRKHQTMLTTWINPSPPGQYGHHFWDDIFKGIFMNDFFIIIIQNALKFVSQGPIDNKAVLAWLQTEDKPLP